MRKSFQLLGMAVVLLVFGFSLPITSFAAGTGGQSGSIDLANLNDNENVTIEKLTYDEMIEEIAANEGISVEKAKAQHPDKSNELQNAASKRATTEGSSCGAVDPHRIGVSLDVSSSYKPTLNLYVWTCGSGSFYSFEEIEDVDINRSYNGTSKGFGGSIKAELTSSTTIWWKVNGDFYNNQEMTISGSATASGLVWSGTASVSSTSNHYAYIYDYDTYSIY